jgi:monofunctional biosynthetic peptidoglycan transglycosylase
VASSRAVRKRRAPKRRAGIVRRFAAGLLLFSLCAYLAVAASLVSLRWIPPLSTALQAQRRVEALFARKPYHKKYEFVRLNRIAPDLQHAVIASEDSRFYQHHGFDWVEIQKAIDDEDEDRPMRGASTITQQLAKNLYLTTQRSFLRKAVEASLVPVAEFALGKQRILELYLNVVEWGPGVFGAEAAAQFHYGVHASGLSREQSARLAAILPNPIRRKPARMNAKAELILARMRQMGW